MIDKHLFLNLLDQVRESSTLEFKREIRLNTSNEKLEFTKDVTALANTQGGYLLFGKEDERHGGKPVGVDPATFNSDQMQQIIAQRCYPPPVFKAYSIEHESKFFVILEIPESKSKPHEILDTKDVWIRRDGITDRAYQKEREQMVEHKQSEKENHLTLNEQLERDGVHEEPESPIRRLVIKLGRWYSLRTYGRLDVPLTKELIVLIISIVVLFSPLIYVFYQVGVTKTVPDNTILVLSVIFALVGIFPILGVETLNKLKCPSCKRNFGIRRTKHIRVKDKILSKMEDQVVRRVTYQNTYTCEYCGYSETKFENTEETIRTN